MRSATIAFLIGILFFQSLNRLPETQWLVWVLPLIIIIIILIGILPRYRLIFMIFILILGFLWTLWRVDMILAQKLPIAIENQDITINGVVINLPQSNHYSWRFDFMPKPMKNWPNPGKIRLSWYGKPPQALRPGQHWQLTVRLKPARGLLNPNVFDYSKYLFINRIMAIGHVRPKGKSQLLSQASAFNIDNLRYHLAQEIKKTLKTQASTPMIIALAVGDKHDISPEQIDILQKTGTIHLMAISGLHIGFIAWLAFWIGSFFYKSQTAILWLPAPRFAAIFCLIAAFSYALLAGLSLPTQRAFIMVAVVAFSIVFARKTAISVTLAFALLLVLLWDPLAVLSAGLWLSFFAVAVIFYAQTGRREPQQQSTLSKWGLGTLKTQLAVTLGLFPVLLAIFGYIPLSSLPANFIAIPWVSFVVVPLTLLGTALISVFPSIGSILLNLAANTLDSLWVSLDYLANFEWNLWQQHIPPTWTVITALIGIAILLLPRGFPAKWLGIIWILPIFLILPNHPNRGEIWFTLLDVGQGLAAIIRTQNYVLIYDTGPKYRSGFNTGKAVIVPFLQAQGIQEIDKLIISHGDNDHSGGADSVLKQLKVKQILSSVPERYKKNNSQPCQAGQYWQWDKVTFEILHPNNPKTIKKKNNRSCVLKITTQGGSILLTGDIEKTIEYKIIKKYPKALKSDILIAPHHGSGTSSTEAFIDIVKPKIALFSTGYKNRFRHPKKSIVERYKRRKIKLWNTAEVGAISFRISPKTGISEPSLARQTMKRYWH